MKFYWEWVLHAPEAEGAPGGEGDAGGKKPEAEAGGDAAAEAAATAAAEAATAAAKAKGGGEDDDGKKPRESLYETAGVEEPGKEGSPTWPEDWRKQMAAGDEKYMKRLERYSSPAEVGKALAAAQQRISSGEYKRDALPEDATDADKKEWNAERGIPDEASGYELPLTLDGDPNDMTDSQKAVLESWQGQFHDLGVSQDTAAALTKHGNEIVEAHMEAVAENDAKQLDGFEDEKRATWGGDFRVNMKMNARFLSEGLGGDEEMKAFVNSRMPDGSLLKNSGKFADWVNKMARDGGSTGSFETGDVSGMTDKVSRKAAIEDIQRTDMSKYTPALRKEYNQLLADMEGKQEIAV